MSTASQGSSLVREMPYAPAGDRARIWHPVALLIGSFVIFFVWAIMPSLVLAGIDATSGKTDLLGPDALLNKYDLAAFGVSFVLILLHFLFWTRVVERRPLTSIGMFRGGSFGPYVNGVVCGALFAALVSLMAVVASFHFGFSMPAMFGGTQSILRPEILLFAAAIVPVLLVQAGTEEIVFRGWMLSAFSARMSLTGAVLLSSVAFGVFHVDRFLLDPKFAAIFIASTIVLGVFLAVWAVQSGSIAGPAGFHGGYNALLLVSGYLDGAANAKPGASPTQVWADMMSLEAMLESIQDTEYVAALETAVIVASLVGIAALIALGRAHPLNSRENQP